MHDQGPFAVLDAMAAALDSLDRDQLDTWGDRALTAEAVEDLFG